MTKSTEIPTSSNSKADTRWWDWFSVVLVVLLLFTASGRLIATRWTDNLGVIMDFVILGTILGLALGRSQFHPILAVLTALAYGILIIPWRLGVTMSQGISWEERVISMAGRIKVIVGQIVNQTDVTDSLLFVVAMSCLFWILCVNAGYVLTRYANAWRIILPPGLTILVIHYYHNCPVVNLRQCVNLDVGHGSTIIAIYLLLSLLLVARTYYVRQTHDWRLRHTFIHSDVNFDLLRVTVVAVVVLMALAWTAPAFGNKLFQNGGPLKSINDSFHSASKFFSHVFASLSLSVGPSPTYFSQGFSLGTGSELSYAMVLQVSAPEPSPTGGNYYWMARVYNDYGNGGWTSNYPFTYNVNAQQPILSSPAIKGREFANFEFYAYKNLGLLFFPSQVVSASRPVTVHVLRNPDGIPDVSLLELVNELYAGERYQVMVSLSTVTVRELKDAGVNYPAWILEQYLKLPDEITPRTRDLAKQITEGLTNPYEIAQAITKYLRENITYSRVIQPIPANVEPLDWFLFDLKEGFCNYYASAEVVLLRSLGIPARLAVGYAQGDRVTQESTPAPGMPPDIRESSGPQIYQVREKDSHAWPQVYFPNIGWIEFEPTSAIREILRPSGEDLSGAVPPIAPQPTPFLNRQAPMLDEPTPFPESRVSGRPNHSLLTRTTIVIILAVLVGLLDISVLLWRVQMARRLLFYFKRWGIQPPIFIQNWAAQEIHPLPTRLEDGLRNIGLQPPEFLRQWALYTQLTPVGRSYIEINRALRRLGARPTPDATPAERAAILVRLAPNTSIAVKSLLSEYQRGMYSPHPVDPKTAKVASREIRKLSYMTLFSRWMDRLRRPIRKQIQKAG